MNLAAAANGLHGFGEGAAETAPRRTIPFDYAFRFDGENDDPLAGEPGRTHNKTVQVSIEATFTAVSIGYGLIPRISPLKFGLLPEKLADGAVGGAVPAVVQFIQDLMPFFSAILPQQQPVPLFAAAAGPASSSHAIRQFAQRSFLRTTVASLAETLDEPLNAVAPVLGPRTAAALRDGIRFNPELIERLLLSLDGDALDDTTLLEAFQIVAAPPDRVQFKYALFDDGSGREFQSEALLNTAGLGSSDGLRPFRYFARPIEFAPRTTIRMQVTEVSDFQGDLHVSLQGYKTLGGVGSPTGPRRARRRS